MARIYVFFQRRQNSEMVHNQRFTLVVAAIILAALSVESKVDLDTLFQSLTVEEKCGQMTQVGIDCKFRIDKN